MRITVRAEQIKRHPFARPTATALTMKIAAVLIACVTGLAGCASRDIEIGSSCQQRHISTTFSFEFDQCRWTIEEGVGWEWHTFVIKGRNGVELAVMRSTIGLPRFRDAKQTPSHFSYGPIWGIDVLDEKSGEYEAVINLPRDRFGRIHEQLHMYSYAGADLQDLHLLKRLSRSIQIAK